MHDFDKSLTKLMANYLVVVTASRAVPFASVVGFFIFFLKYFRWALCSYAVVLVLLVNALLWLYARIRKRPRKKWGWVVVDLFCAPFKSLHRGEIPALTFLVLRGLVRIFIYFRLNGNLSSIRQKLQETKVRDFVGSWPSGFNFEWYERRATLVTDLQSTLKEKLGMAFWSSVTGAAGAATLAKTLYEMLPSGIRGSWEGWAKTLLSPSATAGDVSTIPVSMLWLYDGLALGTYLIWIIVTNFIVMRSILNTAGTYTEERQVLHQMQLPINREIPVDLIGAILMLACMFGAMLLLSIWQRSRAPSVLLADGTFSLGFFVCFLIVLSLPSYALVRRYWINRCQSQ
jgi:hypothetical protein